MEQEMLQECCHLPFHRQPLIVLYTDPGLASQPVLYHVESWSVSPRASIINAYPSGQNLYIDLLFLIGIMVQIPPTRTTLPHKQQLGEVIRNNLSC